MNKIINLENANESFVVYKSWAEMINDAPNDETKIEMVVALFNYCLCGEEYDGENPLVKMFITAIKPNDASAKDRYLNAKDNGKKGGRPKLNLPKDKVIALIQEGKTQMEIAEKFECSVRSLTKIYADYKREKDIQKSSEKTTCKNLSNNFTDCKEDIDNNQNDQNTFKHGLAELGQPAKTGKNLTITTTTNYTSNTTKNNNANTTDTDNTSSPSEEEDIIDIHIDEIDLELFNEDFGLEYTEEDAISLLEDLKTQLKYKGFDTRNIQLGKMLSRVSYGNDRADNCNDIIRDYMLKSEKTITYDLNSCKVRLDNWGLDRHW